MILKYLAFGSASLMAVVGVAYSAFVFMQAKNLKEDLAKNNFKPLSTEIGKDKEIWTKLLTKYETNQNPKIDNLDLSEASEADSKIEKLQKACKALFETKTDAKNYSTLFNVAESWCIQSSKKLNNP